MTTTLSKAGPVAVLSRLAKERVVLLLLATKPKVWDNHPIFVKVFPVTSKLKSWELPPADTFNVLTVGLPPRLPASLIG